MPNSGKMAIGMARIVARIILSKPNDIMRNFAGSNQYPLFFQMNNLLLQEM
jgi:hypothetical protein